MNIENCSTTQQTLAATASLDGIGVHTGIPVSITLQPAAANTGVVWERTDVPNGRGRIPARWDHVRGTNLSTVIGNDHGVTISTIEHLMAALNATGIDNLHIGIDGPEVPIADGSALPWLNLIQRAGIARQPVPRRAIWIEREIEVQHGDSYLRLSPSDQVQYAIEIDFELSFVGRQKFEYVPGAASFAEQIGPARTFGFMRDIAQLRERGLTLGGSLQNAVVIDRDRVINPEGLRFDDEFVRHKILDCMGDLYLAGTPIVGRIEGRKIGHGLNNRLLHELFANRNAWSWRGIGCEDDGPRHARMAA